MRLGVLGPARGDLRALARSAHGLLDQARVDKVVYLSDDDALDRVVASWASQLVGADPRADRLFDRAAARCARASPAQIDAFVASERARLALRVFESLPEAPRRTIEILGGRVVLLVHDKATLDEEDIVAASILVFGKSAEPLIKRIGARIFVAPGPAAGPNGGSAVLDDAGGAVTIEILDAAGGVAARDVALGPRALGKMRVQSEPAT